MFELTQTAELSHWKGDRRDPAWQAFVKDLRGHLGSILGKLRPHRRGDVEHSDSGLFQANLA